MSPSCTDCKHSRPYDEFINQPRMCDVDPQGVHACTFAREKYGVCGPEGKLWEARG